MWGKTKWLTVPEREYEKWKIYPGNLSGRFAYYRCILDVAEASMDGRSMIIQIAANSRYRLWINEKPILSGSAKGDEKRFFYDTVEVGAYLKKGRNIIAVQVLYNDASIAPIATERAAIVGVKTPGGVHRLAIMGELKNQEGQVVGSISTGSAPWKVYLDGSFYLKSIKNCENLGGTVEEIDFNRSLSNWKQVDYDDNSWAIPEDKGEVETSDFYRRVGFINPYEVMPRPIPLLYERETAFAEEIVTPQTIVNGAKETGLAAEILDTGSIEVLPGKTTSLILSAGVELNAQMQYHFTGGKGARVSLRYAERFELEGTPIPIHDWERGHLDGIVEHIILDGSDFTYEPFWYKTFLYLQITIEAAEEPVIMKTPVIRKTGYPIEIGSKIRSCEEWVGQLWDMCVRTLENCMVETYMDCPFYEQLQYPMDSRLQMLFNYTVSNDTRLARKCIDDLHNSKSKEGLIQGRFPSCYGQIISTFSLYYIFMLQEYYQQTGDKEVLREYSPDVDGIINYYDRHLNQKGLVQDIGFWQFVDWRDQWNETAGAPDATLQGPSTIINLMYAYALKRGADIYKALGREGIAAEYDIRREKLLSRLWRQCWSEKRHMFREGPQVEVYSRHAQAWAILNDMVEPEGARIMISHALEPDVITCSFSTSYEWFRACEKAGVYQWTKTQMQDWIGLIARGNTTCPEVPNEGRSECHAWSALPMYEMVRTMAGIQSATPGWKEIIVRPNPAYLDDLHGEVVTPQGNILFEYVKTDNGWSYKLDLPEGMLAELEMHDGSRRRLDSGMNYILES